MARKYGKNETTLSNVLKLVKALLALADEEIAVPGDKLKATFKVEWVKEDELLVSGKVQQKRNNRTQTVEKGITKEDLWTLVECLGEALELCQPKDEEKVDNTQRKSNAIQDILDCLKDLDILVEELIDGKPTVKTQGFWKFSLKLEHQTKTEENLKLIKEKWKIKIGSVTVETSHQTVISKDKTLNWQEICQQNLALQKQLTTNPFTNAYGVTPQLDEIYVPLAVVERKPPKPPSRNQPEEKEEEKLIPIAEECFFEDVLRQGKSQISQGRKIAIIGEPGSGKTTRLQKIADWILEQDLGLPIWISLADLTQPTVSQYIEEIWLKQTGKSLTIDELTQEKERIWLLLDGLDEMTSKVEMRHVWALLGGWVQAARVVVTCRVNVWEADKNAFSGFDVFRNLEFNPEQVTDYIRRWFVGLGDAATGESLEEALAQSENSRLKELIQNPLRLWMLCQIWQTGGGLPETQAGLYGQFVDWVYDWKEDEEILDQREAIDKALARLALAAMEQKDEVSRLRLRESWVLKVLGSRPIFQAVMKLGWLNRVERFPEEICVFYHATFQEYFAALAVDDWDYFLPRNHVNFPVAGKEYRIFEPQWKQVILLWLGRGDVVDEEKERFIEKLVNFEQVDRGFYEYRAYFLAAAGINEFKACSLASEIVREVVKWGFGYFNIEKQEWQVCLDPIKEGARETIAETIQQLAITELCCLLNNFSCPESIRWQTSLILLEKVSLGNIQTITSFVNLINVTKDVNTLYWAISSLEDIAQDNHQAIATLTRIIKTTNDEDIRGIAAFTLEKIDHGNNQAISASINILETTEAYYERAWRNALECLRLVGTGNSQVITTLIRVVKNSDCKFMINYDLRGKKRLTVNLEIETNIQLWLKLILTIEVLRDVGKGNPQAIAELTQILDSIEDESILSLVAFILAEIDPGNYQAIATLVNLFIITENQEVSEWIAERLENIAQGNPQAVNALTRLLETTKDEIICSLAASTLAKIDPSNRQAITTLAHLFVTTKSQDIREWIAERLENVAQGNPQAVNALTRLLETTKDEGICFLATSTLAKIDPGNYYAITTLTKLLNTDNEINRILAAFSLVKTDPNNSQAIITLFNTMTVTNDKNVSEWIADSLEELNLSNLENAASLVNFKNQYISEKSASLEIINTSCPPTTIDLVRVIKTTEDEDILRRAAYILIERTISTLQEYADVVSGLKDCLSDEVYQNDFNRFHQCYEVVWGCATNLPYPDFYRAWHGLTETQTLNLAQLPQLLQTQLTETNLHQTLQLLCIDGSKFDNRDNPATDIYLQLIKKHHCPKSTEGTPRTLTELKIYWQLLDWEKHPILIFYEEAIPQGFSPTFLDAIARFDATICAIADSPHPTIPTFSPQDPHIIQTIMNWIKRTILEA